MGGQYFVWSGFCFENVEISLKNNENMSLSVSENYTNDIYVN